MARGEVTHLRAPCFQPELGQQPGSSKVLSSAFEKPTLSTLTDASVRPRQMHGFADDGEWAPMAMLPTGEWICTPRLSEVVLKDADRLRLS